MKKQFKKTVIINRAVPGSGKTTLARCINSVLKNAGLSIVSHSTDNFFMQGNQFSRKINVMVYNSFAVHQQYFLEKNRKQPHLKCKPRPVARIKQIRERLCLSLICFCYKTAPGGSYFLPGRLRHRYSSSFSFILSGIVFATGQRTALTIRLVKAIRN